MAPSGRGRGKGRGGATTRVGPASIRPPQPGLELDSWTLRDEHAGSSDDIPMQPPDIVVETEFVSPNIAPHTSRDENVVDQVSVQIPSPLVQAANKRGRGPAKCTEFEKIRKHGLISLKINDGETTPCCENATMFTTRVTWILKHHADMSYARWTDVPMVEKDELIDRVRADFIFDWEKKNHQKTVWKQLRKRFNAFHHQLHKKYLEYATHEEALASSGSGMVDPLVWVKLCQRWGSDAFKKLSKQNQENRKLLKTNHTAGRKSFVRILEEKRSTTSNLVDFYKDVRWSNKKGKFVTEEAEHIYKSMVGKFNDIEPEQRTTDAARSVFREVLGARAGYARGLGEMVIPETTRLTEHERDKQYAEAVGRHQKEAEHYKEKYNELSGHVRVLLERQLEFEKFMNTYQSERQSQGESPRETQGAA